MSDALLEDYTRQHIAAHDVPEVTFAWQGGEPTLMGLEFFRRAVELQEKYRKPGTRIVNTIQTNATTLNEEWCRFFHEQRFLVGISLDGPRALHDAYRVDKGGSPTFDRVMAGVALAKQHQVEFNILTTVNAANGDHGLEVYRFLRDEVGTSFVQFIPIVERDNATGYQEGDRVTERSVTGQQYGRFLIAVFDEWVRRDVGRVFVQLFDISLGVWLGEPSSLVRFRGDLRRCAGPGAQWRPVFLRSLRGAPPPAGQRGPDAARGAGEFTPAASVRFEQARHAAALLPRMRRCGSSATAVVPRTGFSPPPTASRDLNYLCEGFKAFFTHIDRPMKIMANLILHRRPPAEIMAMLAAAQARPKA